jgi:hypothetical protein
MRNRDDKQKEHLRQLIIKWNNYFVFCMTQKQKQKHLLLQRTSWILYMVIWKSCIISISQPESVLSL